MLYIAKNQLCKYHFPSTMLAGLAIVIFKSVFRVCSSIIGVFYFGYFRPGYKRLLRQMSNQCEIERILSSGRLSMAAKIRKLEYSLRHSRQARLNQILVTLSALREIDNDLFGKLAQTIAGIKRITDVGHRQWLENELTMMFRMITGYRCLIDRIEEERSISYDSENNEHEELLLKLWSLLKPNDELTNRISYQWTEIGFQGENPATDFRGMGILGLRQLVYFSEFRADRANQLLSKSNHPTKGYPFAIVGISMTSLARDLLREGALSNHFYNQFRHAAQLEDFHRVYCELFSIFDTYWTRMNPRSIMEFVPLRRQFHNALRGSLSSEDVVLQEVDSSEVIE